MNKKITVFFFLLFAALATYFGIQYFSENTIAVMDPKGIIADKQRNLIVIATLLMLTVVIPVFVLAIYVSWKFKAGNTKAEYTPDWNHSHLIESIWWGFPFLIIIALSYLTYTSSHELDPFKSLDENKKPLTIQVVALNWKWLFIYPEQNIATVNFLQIPEKTPILFDITADAPMNSFWVPQLAGQIFAMPGMKTKLNILANETGDFYGSSANLSGKGFSGMNFNVKATSDAEFAKWVETMKQSKNILNLEEYKKLAKPSEYNPKSTYVLKKDDLYEWIVMKYMMPMQDSE